MGGALASGLLRRVKPQTGVRSRADPNRNLFLIFVSHPKGAVQGIWQRIFTNLRPVRRFPTLIRATIPVSCTQTAKFSTRPGQGIYFAGGREFFRARREVHGSGREF